MFTHMYEQRGRMDLVIELDNEGRIWVSGSDGSAPEEAWLQGADDTPDALRASGLCLLEENIRQAHGHPPLWIRTKSPVSCGLKPAPKPKSTIILFATVCPINTNANH